MTIRDSPSTLKGEICTVHKKNGRSEHETTFIIEYIFGMAHSKQAEAFHAILCQDQTAGFFCCSQWPLCQIRQAWYKKLVQVAVSWTGEWQHCRYNTDQTPDQTLHAVVKTHAMHTQCHRLPGMRNKQLTIMVTEELFVILAAFCS